MLGSRKLRETYLAFIIVVCIHLASRNLKIHELQLIPGRGSDREILLGILGLQI